MTAELRDALLNTLFSYPATAILNYAHTRMVSVPKKHFYIWAVSALMICARCLLLATGFENLNFILVPLMIAGMLFFSDDRWGYRIFATGIEFVCLCLTELLGDWLLTALGLKMMPELDSVLIADMGAYLTVRAATILIEVTLIYLMVVLWRLLILKSAQATLLSFGLFPVSQGILCLFASGMVTSAGGKQADYLELSLLMLLSLAADIVMLWAIRRLRQGDEVRERAALLEQQLGLQKAYYERVMRDAEDTARVRHDLRNQLQTACALFESGNAESAKKLLDETTNRIASVQVFCENAVVNAVLNEKAERCRAEGVAFRCAAAVPGETGISEMDLCSLFANVMDNAISGCLASGAPQPEIMLSAAVRQGFLSVKCENTAKPAEKKPAAGPGSEHGWGLLILGDMAKRCGGSLRTEQRTDKYCTEVFLKCGKTAAT